MDAKVSKLPGADKYQEQEYGYGTEGTEEGSAFVNLLDSSGSSTLPITQKLLKALF